MSENLNSETAVYVELDALANWSTRMESINKEAKTILESFTSSVNDLEQYWVGNSATGFLNASEKLMTRAKTYHDQMKNTSDFLIEVARTMESE